MKKKALGRGLGALIPEVSEPNPVETPSGDIDIDLIVTNPHQPRVHFDEARLEELATSIRENGILQPILVRPFGGKYQLVAGERRLSAAQRAGLLKVPSIIKDVPDDRMLELALIENIQREPLNPVEEAQAYQRLTEALNATREEIAERLGKDRSTIANSIRLLKLPSSIGNMVAEGKLSPGHARALLASNAMPSAMIAAAEAIIAKGWSVREAERWAKAQARPPLSPKIQDPNEAAAADRLRLALGTKVEIHARTKNTGEIRIHYFNQDELDRIYSLLTEKQN